MVCESNFALLEPLIVIHTGEMPKCADLRPVLALKRKSAPTPT